MVLRRAGDATGRSTRHRTRAETADPGVRSGVPGMTMRASRRKCRRTNLGLGGAPGAIGARVRPDEGRGDKMRSVDDHAAGANPRGSLERRPGAARPLQERRVAEKRAR